MVADIAILGAGPSGLVLARILQVNNISYTVFERDTHPSNDGQGGTLDIHDNSGQLALKEAGLLEQFEAIARYDAQRFSVVDHHGNEVCKYDSTGTKGRPEIDRKDLRALLLASVPAERVLWSHKVEKVRRDQDGTVSVQFENRDVQSGFKLVVGADGTWSKARELVTSAQPLYSGFCYLQSIIGPQDELYDYLVSKAGKGMHLGMGEGKQIVAQNLGDGSYNVYIGLRMPENWVRPDTDAELRDSLLKGEFADWHPELKALLAHCKAFHTWRLCAMEPHKLSWQTVPGQYLLCVVAGEAFTEYLRQSLGVALIGDAAHASTPFVGEVRIMIITVLRDIKMLHDVSLGQ